MANQVESIAPKIEQSSEVSNDKALLPQLLSASRKLSAVLDNLRERIHIFVFQPMENAAIRVAMGLDLFDIIANNERPTSAKERDAATGSGELLID